MDSRISSRRPLWLGAGLVLTLVAALSAATQSSTFAQMAGASSGPENSGPPLRLSETMSPAPAQTLAAAFDTSEEQLAALASWNLEGLVPARNGFVRPLVRPIEVLIDSARALSVNPAELGTGWLVPYQDRVVWGTSVEIEEAYRLRLRLEATSLPAGTELWVWGEGEQPRSFGLELRDQDGALWTPSVGGPVLNLEIAIPVSAILESRATLTISADQVLEIFPLDAGGTPLRSELRQMTSVTNCLIDAACVSDAAVPNISLLKKGVGHMQYVSGGSSYLCTGNLLNNTAQNFIPYFLTANHCIDSQPEASSLEVFWDFIAQTCGGSWPSLGTLPRSSGATLLAAGATTDFSLLRLSSVPANRTFFGWNANATAAPNGTLLPRLSHPLGFPMAYSETTVWNPTTTCTGLSTTNFLYSDLAPDSGHGTPMGGSSGSSTFVLSGQVVGQLLGVCPGTDEPCLIGPADPYSNVDGRLSVTFPSISQYLSPPPAGGPCVPGPTTLCIDDHTGDKRFKVEVHYQSALNGGISGDGSALPLSSLGVTKGGLFTFFGGDNPELMVKVVNGCGLNNHFWLYASGVTNLGLTVTVTDTIGSGAPFIINNPDLQVMASVATIEAFPCP